MTIALPTVEVTGEYLLDPETEDLIWGDRIREGMVVLAESQTMRYNLETRRWCRITSLRQAGDMVRFIGVYADGSKFSRSYNLSWAWLVKLDSLPEAVR